jgi:ankyrin repeat protein
MLSKKILLSFVFVFSCSIALQAGLVVDIKPGTFRCRSFTELVEQCKSTYGSLAPALLKQALAGALFESIDAKSLKDVKRYVAQDTDVIYACVPVSAFGDTETSLHRAVVIGSLEIVKYIACRMCELFRKEYQDQTPFKQTLSYTLNGFGSGPTLLHAAVRSGHCAVAEWLLENGISANAKGFCGNTAMHEAVLSVANLYGDDKKHNERMAIVDALIAHGANVNAKNDEDKTPLVKLVTTTRDSGCLELHSRTVISLMKKLLDAGAKTLVDDHGETLLHYLSMRGCVYGEEDALVFLCDYIDVNAICTDENGKNPQTPIDVARFSSDGELLRHQGGKTAAELGLK